MLEETHVQHRATFNTLAPRSPSPTLPAARALQTAGDPHRHRPTGSRNTNPRRSRGELSRGSPSPWSGSPEEPLEVWIGRKHDRHMMYTITRGPSKLVTQRRTGPTQQPMESKATDLKHKRTHWIDSNAPAPKIVFQRLNTRRSLRSSSPKEENTAEDFTPAHEENVRFVYEAWQEVEQKLGDAAQLENGSGLVQYAERNPSPSMKNFVPIDLEEWWAQRFLATIAEPS